MQVCSASMTTPDAARRELALQVVGDPLGQPLLGLHAAGVEVDQPGELGEPEDALPGQVPDVRHPDERQHVVLAQRLDRDVLDEHQLVVRLVVGEGRQVERPGRRASRRRHAPSGRASRGGPRPGRSTPRAASRSAAASSAAVVSTAGCGRATVAGSARGPRPPRGSSSRPARATGARCQQAEGDGGHEQADVAQRDVVVLTRVTRSRMMPASQAATSRPPNRGRSATAIPATTRRRRPRAWRRGRCRGRGR